MPRSVVSEMHGEGDNTPRRLKVLLVEDSEDDAILVGRALRQSGFDPIVLRVEAFGALSAALRKDDWDIVLSDHNLPGFTAQQALELVRNRWPELPFVVVSGCIGEEAAVALMRAGAQDYVLKGNLAKLGPVVEREIAEHRMRLERRRAEEAQREVEAIHQAILQNAAEGIVTFGEDGCIRSLNRCACEMFGYLPQEALGQSILSLFHRDFSEACRMLLEQPARCTDSSFAVPSIEILAVRKDRSTFCAQVNASGVRLGAGWFLTLFLRDVTEQKRAEMRYRQQVERLGALRRVDIAINSSLNLNLMLSVIVDQVIAQTDADAADVLLLDGDTQALKYASGRGLLSPDARKRCIRVGEGCAGKAALERRMVRWSRLRGNHDLCVHGCEIQSEGFQAGWAVPLASKGKLLGVLEAFFRREPEASDELMEFVEVLASQGALAIESASLFERLLRTNTELQIAYDATLEGWSKAMDLRDHETEGHSQRVTAAVVELARAFGLEDEDIAHVRRGALLHDIGKLGIPDSILLKPGPLTEDEWVQMRKHPVYAYERLFPIEYLRPAIDIPYCHHEEGDGSGYPRGLRGEEIPLSARLFAVIDVWDALLSDRPYRKAWRREDALAYIRSQSGTHFDPAVVRRFVDIEPALPRD
ncbi:MAG: PAS domain S-box protein [Fimbriimonadales bacterium]|nr:PAS domain S-box protein [Fimbriimonadales bacterium]